MVVHFSEDRRRHDEGKRERTLKKIESLGKRDGFIDNSRLIRNQGVKKYVGKISGRTKVDWEKVNRESLWDGLYGVCTNITDQNPETVFSARYNLWRIENLFRVNKHTLQMRPIYHRKTQRIKAHILICFLAYVVVKSTEMILEENNLKLSIQGLIEALKNVESVMIRDETRFPHKLYALPMKLSKEAEQIYKVFRKKFPQRPYPITHRK